jgi:hypothetical protein
MASREEKARNKELKQQVRDAERERLRTSLPCTPEKMRQLFEFLAAKIEDSGCPDTLENTLQFLRSQSLPEQGIIKWLDDSGGFCDCEVLYNAEEKFLFAFPEFAH